MTEKHIELAKKKEESLVWDNIKNDKQEVVNRLRSMIVNGKKLNDNEVMALAVYSTMNDLNPMNGEAYFLPGSGPIPGIQGYRKKARLSLRMEAAENKVRGAYFTEDYTRIDDPKIAGHEPDKGDIAFQCTVRDLVSLQGHTDMLVSAVKGLVQDGVDVDTAYRIAEKIAGKPPEWTAIGIVYGSENFGSKEMFARVERARKRAAKLAIKKRWPSLDLPSNIMDQDGWEDEPMITVSTPQVQQLREGEGTGNPTSEQIMEELGFGSDQTPDPASDVEEGQYRENEPEPTPAPKAHKGYTREDAAKAVSDKDKEAAWGEKVEGLPTRGSTATEYPKNHNEYYQWVSEGQVPHVGIRDAKMAYEKSKMDVNKAWDMLIEKSHSRSSGDEQSDQQPGLGIS